MDYDYQYGNNYYKYYGNKGIRSTVYNILAITKSTARYGIRNESTTYL